MIGKVFIFLSLFQFRSLQPLYYLGYRFFGVLMNFSVGGSHNGEAWILQQWGKYTQKHHKDLVIFDVGANIGQYANMINVNISQKTIFSFEPSKSTFEQLLQNTGNISRIQHYNFGFSDTHGSLELFYENSDSCRDVTHACASLYRNNITEFVSQNITSEAITLQTVDEFCKKENIAHIDLLKIDIEGNEYRCLLGAQNMLASGHIDMIQVELNRCAIASRVFFKDYWDLLSGGYDVYRLLSWGHGLFPLKSYDPAIESFTYVNYIFIRKGSNITKFFV